MHWSAVATRHAHDVMHRAVNLDDLAARIAGPLMQAVDVLSNQRVQLAARFEIHQSTMAGIGNRLPCRMCEALLPDALILMLVLNWRLFLVSVVLVPACLWTFAHYQKKLTALTKELRDILFSVWRRTFHREIPGP